MKQEEKLIKSTHQCFSFWYNVLCLGTHEQSHYNSFITPFKAIFSCCLYLQGVATADSPKCSIWQSLHNIYTSWWNSLEIIAPWNKTRDLSLLRQMCKALHNRATPWNRQIKRNASINCLFLVLGTTCCRKDCNESWRWFSKSIDGTL